MYYYHSSIEYYIFLNIFIFGIDYLIILRLVDIIITKNKLWLNVKAMSWPNSYSVAGM